MLLGLAPETRVGLQAILDDTNNSPSVPVQMGYLRDLAKRGCLEVAGYGDRHPRDKLDLDSPKNRRVEIVLEFREPMGSDATTSAQSNPCEGLQ